jgi:acyl-CoA synthetase (AMP-forming)/AMP-acid ligase II
MGLTNGIIQPVNKGRPCYLMPPVSLLMRPIRWLQAISRYKATISGGPNFAYHLCTRRITPQQGETLDLAYAGTGNAMSIAPNRISYLFDFRGLSLAIDTACSSSLVAVHLACRSLRNGESKLGLAGGVNLILSPAIAINFTKAGAMAPAGVVDPTLEALDEAVPAPVLSAARYARFSSRGGDGFADKMLSALRYQFDGHKEKPASQEEGA